MFGLKIRFCKILDKYHVWYLNTRKSDYVIDVHCTTRKIEFCKVINSHFFQKSEIPLYFSKINYKGKQCNMKTLLWYISNKPWWCNQISLICRRVSFSCASEQHLDAIPAGTFCKWLFLPLDFFRRTLLCPRSSFSFCELWCCDFSAPMVSETHLRTCCNPICDQRELPKCDF